ncbi:MAG: amino acid ABC transporter ATP-binding protein [Deltaproteobacteria bacterium]|nr:amino acid ABC transporter ATP-binding protein [Deltaproteobacteria bacterium]
MSVRVDDLSCARGGTRILDAVSFDVAEGGLAAVLGASGAGKTTLLRCLSGLEPFDRGVVDVGGRVVIASEAARRGPSPLRGWVGLVFQTFELFPHLSVLDNCLLAPVRVRGESRAVAEERARAHLHRLGLGTKVDAWPDHLSGGQRQRAAIARALTMQPRVLLYDEPTSALDVSLRNEVIEALRDVREANITQLVVTHDLRLVREATETVVVLDRGRVVEAGPTAAVFGAPQAPATQRLLLA